MIKIHPKLLWNAILWTAGACILYIVTIDPCWYTRAESRFVPNVKPVIPLTIAANISQYFALEDNVISVKFEADQSVDFQPDDNAEIFASERGSKMRRYNEELKRAITDRSDWGYRVVVKEFFSGLPSLVTNRNHGVIRIQPETNEGWSLYASFYTPLLYTWIGVEAHNRQTFEEGTLASGERGTVISEKLWFRCPPCLQWACEREVRVQRPKVLGRIEALSNLLAET